jgi:hypothetical protein
MARPDNLDSYLQGPSIRLGLLTGLGTVVVLLGITFFTSPTRRLDLGWVAVALGQGATAALGVLLTLEHRRHRSFRQEVTTFATRGRAPVIEQSLKVVLGRMRFAGHFQALKQRADQGLAVEEQKLLLRRRCAEALADCGAVWAREADRRWWRYLGLSLFIFVPTLTVAFLHRAPDLSFSRDPDLALDVATVELMTACLAGLFVRRQWFRAITEWGEAALEHGVEPALSRLQPRPVPPPVVAVPTPAPQPPSTPAIAPPTRSPAEGAQLPKPTDAEPKAEAAPPPLPANGHLPSAPETVVETPPPIAEENETAGLAVEQTEESSVQEEETAATEPDEQPETIEQLTLPGRAPAGPGPEEETREAGDLSYGGGGD